MTLAASAIYPGWVYLHSRLGVPHQRCEITDLSAISATKADRHSDGAMVASGSSVPRRALVRWHGLARLGWLRVVGSAGLGFAAACRVRGACRVRARGGGRFGAAGRGSSAGARGGRRAAALGAAAG